MESVLLKVTPQIVSSVRARTLVPEVLQVLIASSLPHGFRWACAHVSQEGHVCVRMCTCLYVYTYL